MTRHRIHTLGTAGSNIGGAAALSARLGRSRRGYKLAGFYRQLSALQQRLREDSQA